MGSFVVRRIHRHKNSHFKPAAGGNIPGTRNFIPWVLSPFFSVPRITGSSGQASRV